jgi:hypothetical protein
MAAAKPSARTVKGKIALILSQVEPLEKIYSERSLVDSTRASRQLDEFGRLARALGPKPDPIAQPGQFVVTHGQVQLLRALYTSLPPVLQRTFPALLWASVEERNSHVVVHTLLDLGRLQMLVKLLSGRRVPMPLRVLVWATIGEALAYESNRFGDRELELLDRAQKDDRRRFPELQYAPEDSMLQGRRYVE